MNRAGNQPAQDRPATIALLLGILLALSSCQQRSPGQSGLPAKAADGRAARDRTGAAGVAWSGDDRLATKRSTARAEGDDYLVTLPLNELMVHVIQHAGQGVWKYQGYVTDAHGEHSLSPKSEAEWEDAESAARTLAELTNVLLLPGRRIDEGQWVKAVQVVRETALKEADAAERHDRDAFTAIGGQLDEACDVCHRQYDPTFVSSAKP